MHLSSTAKTPLVPKTLNQICQQDKNSDFIRDLNVFLGAYGQQNFEELERALPFLLARISGDKTDNAIGVPAQPSGGPQTKPAFCVSGVSYNSGASEVVKNLLCILTWGTAKFRNYPGTFPWPHKIWGKRALPELFSSTHSPYQGSYGVAQVETTVFFLLHFARLPVDKFGFFSKDAQQSMSSDCSRNLKAYRDIFDWLMKLFMKSSNTQKSSSKVFWPSIGSANTKKDKKQSAVNKLVANELPKYSVHFVQVFGNWWFTPPFAKYPVIYRRDLLPSMKKLVERIMKIQAFTAWESQNSQEPWNWSRTCLAKETESLRQPLYTFLIQAFTEWPLDLTQDLQKVIDTWLMYITPWNVDKSRRAKMSDDEFKAIWGPWIAENLPFYSTCFVEFLRLSVNMDLSPSWILQLLSKVFKTFDNRVLALVKQFERSLQPGSGKQQNEYWVKSVEKLLDGKQSLLWGPGTDPDEATMKVVNALTNNLLEFEEQARSTANVESENTGWFSWMSESTSSSPNRGYKVTKPMYKTNVNELKRVFGPNLKITSTPTRRKNRGLRYCEVDPNGELTQKGRQQLLQGRVFDVQQTHHFLHLNEDPWEAPQMSFELDFSLDRAKKLETGIRNLLGIPEDEFRHHFLYGKTRSLASTSCLCWTCFLLLVGLLAFNKLTIVVLLGFGALQSYSEFAC